MDDRDRRILALIRSKLRLDGEDVVRISTGKAVRAKPHPKLGYQFVRLLQRGEGALLPLHRAKFALLHGYLPETVDHKDVDRANNLGDNLRAATFGENNVNRKGRASKLGLPKHVSMQRHGTFCVRMGGMYVGTFKTLEAATAAARAAAPEAHGEFHWKGDE